jgi:hypothetical protein
VFPIGSRVIAEAAQIVKRVQQIVARDFIDE